MPCCVVTAFTNALWRDLPFGPMSCLNFSAITMVLSSRYIQRQYLLANKLFWVSTLTEADIAFVRAEILSHFAIFTAILLSILEFSPFTKDHSPFFFMVPPPHPMAAPVTRFNVMQGRATLSTILDIDDTATRR
ncbi:hypothetical protein AYX15_02181 [Cryptococcus neoformans]|nr:hypothetical protein AYX15_02181 [Cryptococcus neoformans var. grubii]